MRSLFTALGFLALSFLLLTAASRAGSLSSSATPPTIDGADIAMLNTVGAFDPANTGCCGGGDGGHIWSNRPVQGQTFTTLGNPTGYTLYGLTLQNEENTVTPNTATFTVNLGTVAGNVLTPIHTETASGVSYVPGDFITMTFASPVFLSPNTTYGFDWGTSGSGFTTYNNDNANYAGGEGYSSGANSTPDNNNLIFRGIDRVFHANIELGPIPVEPFGPGSFAINMEGRNPPNPVASGETAGVVPVSNWNNIDNSTNVSGSFGPFQIAGSSGGQSATLTWSATGTWGRTALGNPGGDDEMMAGHIEATGAGEARATVSGLADNFSSYDVYVYVGDDAGDRNGEIRFNDGAPQTFTSKLFDGTYTEGTDYFLFQGITGDSFTVSVEPVNDDGANRTGIRGIQVVGVPEPTTGMLAALGIVLAMGACRLRRR